MGEIVLEGLRPRSKQIEVELCRLSIEVSRLIVLEHDLNRRTGDLAQSSQSEVVDSRIGWPIAKSSIHIEIRVGLRIRAGCNVNN